MEITVLVIVFATIGSLAWVALVVAGCYCYHVRRRRPLSEEDAESLQTILPEAKVRKNISISKKLRNGIINFKSPVVRTLSVGAQLDATIPSLASRPSPQITPQFGRRPSDQHRTVGTLSLNRPNQPTSLNVTPAGGNGGSGGGASGSSGGAGVNGSSLIGAVGGGGASASVSACTAAASSDKSSAPNKTLHSLKQEHPSKAFWQNRSISLVDMYIDNSEPTENVGQIHFSLEYDFDNTTLILKIMQGKDLPAKDITGTSDPYVRVTLLPDKKHRLETKIKRRTLNPRWNETFYFEGFPIQKLQNRVLHLHVFDYDRFSRDDAIGEVFLPLCQVDFSEKPVFWKALKPPLKDKCGELLVSLSYHPTNSTLTLIILKARSLKAKDINGKSDPYVKVWLCFGEKRVEKRKTPVYKCTLEPVFNETFTFNVPWEKIRECSLDVRVMDFDNIGRNELIGRICLAGKSSTGASETKQWQDMIMKPRQAVVQWHRLKPE